MNTSQKIVTLAAIIGLAGCAAPARQPTTEKQATAETQLPAAKQPAIRKEQSLSTIHTTVEYIGPDYAPLSAESHPDRIVLLFPPVPAGIFGNRERAVIYKAVPDRQLSFNLNLDSGKQQLENFAEPLSAEWADHGLNIAPEQTRLVRIVID